LTVVSPEFAIAAVAVPIASTRRPRGQSKLKAPGSLDITVRNRELFGLFLCSAKI
jgi:hypothetical protein